MFQNFASKELMERKSLTASKVIKVIPYKYILVIVYLHNNLTHKCS